MIPPRKRKFPGYFYAFEQVFDSLSFYGFGIRCTPWRPCDSLAKKRQSPNHLRRVFWRLSRCLKVIRISRESLGIFMWYLDKTPGQIEGMTNWNLSRFQRLQSAFGIVPVSSCAVFEKVMWPEGDLRFAATVGKLQSTDDVD